MKWTFPILIALIPWLSSAAEIPKPVLPAGVGVNIHFVRGHRRDLDLIAAAGFKFVRMDFGWASIEREKGQYDWSGYDQLLNHLDARGLRAVLILDYSNPLYEEVVTSRDPIHGRVHRSLASPQHAESVAAFARWAAASVRHFQGRHVIWEIWNEPNIQFWSPHPDVEQYTRLALETCRAIRDASPDATIVGPASSGFPWKFLESFLKSGVLNYLDGVSVHPYRDYSRSPETAAADFARLRELVDRYAPPARRGKIPILSGEWGYATHRHGVSLQTQAAFAARQQLANLLEGVPLSIWYDWQNDGTDPNEREHNFGAVLPNLEPKPAYVAIRTLTHQLGGFRIVKREALPSKEDYLLLCINSTTGAKKLAGWTTGKPHVIQVAVQLKGTRTFSGVTSMDKSLQLHEISGRMDIELGPAPVYVALGDAALEPGPHP